jgi:hypothetical protein
LLYTIGTTAESPALPSHLPEKLVTEIFQGLCILDAEYEPTRNYLEVGGYSIIAETEEDISSFKHINLHTRQPEWATFIGNTGYISALYIISNSVSIMAYMPLTIAPNIIRKELEE